LIVAASSSLTLLEPVLPLHLSEHFGLTPAQIGLAFGIAILGYALSATGVGALADRFGSTLTAAAGLLLMASMLPLFAHANSIAQLGVLLGAFGVSSALALTPTMSAMADAIDGIDPSQRAGTSPPDYAGVYAIYNAAYALGMWLGPVLGASLVQHTGLGAGLGYAALGAGVCAALAVRRVNFPR
jgi:MFS family permease